MWLHNPGVAEGWADLRQRLPVVCVPLCFCSSRCGSRRTTWFTRCWRGAGRHTETRRLTVTFPAPLLQFTLRQQPDDVVYTVLARGADAPTDGDAAALRDYFNLGSRLAPLAAGWAAADKRFRDVHPHIPGWAFAPASGSSRGAAGCTQFPAVGKCVGSGERLQRAASRAQTLNPKP